MFIIMIEFIVYIGDVGHNTICNQFMYLFFQIDMTSEKSKISNKTEFVWKLATIKKSMN